MARSLKKGPFVDHHLMDKVVKQNSEGTKKAIKTWSRRSMIIPEMVGHTFEVHNGKKFIPVFVSETWLGIVWESFLPRVFSKGTQRIKQQHEEFANAIRYCKNEICQNQPKKSAICSWLDQR